MPVALTSTARKFLSKSGLNCTCLLISAFLLAGAVRGQGLSYSRADTGFHQRIISGSQFDSMFYHLDPVAYSGFTTHFRISLNSQIIDLFVTAGEDYGGMVTNTITECTYARVKESDYKQIVSKREVFEKLELDKNKVRQVLTAIIASGQFELPTDSLIPGWNRWCLHCNSVSVIFKMNGRYRATNYYCPQGQPDTVKYSAVIRKNCDLINATFNLDSLYNLFQGKLPKGKTYSRDGYRMMYILTDEESAYLKKTQPRRDYLKLKKDAIDSLINLQLHDRKIALTPVNCFEDYWLVFRANGKLKKITVADYNRPKLEKALNRRDFRADKREISQCKQKIREIFKTIDLRLLHLKYGFRRAVTFDLDRQIQLRDNTIY